MKYSQEALVTPEVLKRIIDEERTTDIRLATKKFSRLTPGDFLVFNGKVHCQIREVRNYVALEEAFAKEGDALLLPGKTPEQTMDTLRKFFAGTGGERAGLVVFSFTVEYFT